MSKIQVNEIVNHFDTGAPDCPKGLTVTGFSTFTGSASFSGDVSIGGTLTYEDVTNIDSVGVITARSRLDIGVGGTILTSTTSGSIGIGVTNPSGKLEVGAISAGIVTTGDLLVTTESTNATVTIGRLSSTSDDNTTLRVRDRVDRTVFEVGTARLLYNQAGNERIHINSSGKIGIGTTGSSDPNDMITLTQNDNIRWLSSVGNLRQAIECTGADGMDFYTGSNNLAARINSLANLNLGGGSAIAASSTSGDFSVDIGGLRQVVGSAWRQASLLVYYSGIDGDATDGVTQFCTVRLRGLNTWNNRAVTDIVGTATVTISNSSQTGCTLTFDVSNSNSGSVIMFLTGGSGTDSFPTLTINA